MLFVVLCIVVGLLIRRLYCDDNNNNNNNNQVLVLHQSGAIDCQQGTDFTISSNSRIGWFGCWLLLKQNCGQVDFFRTDRLTACQFVYRDSVSASDYSRVCRQILRAITLNNTV